MGNFWTLCVALDIVPEPDSGPRGFQIGTDRYGDFHPHTNFYFFLFFFFKKKKKKVRIKQKIKNP